MRIPYALEEAKSRPLITRLQELAQASKLILSDDVTSTRTVEQMMTNLRIERERVGLMNPPIQLGKWSIEQRILFFAAAAGLIALAWWAYQQVTNAAHVAG